MHIILGFLGSVITILILLNRLAEAGIDLGGLNPFLWHRRRKWQKKIQGDPIYHIDSPLELTALLITATAKADGDMSSEEKKAILRLFQTEFNMAKREAAGLLISSAYLLGNGQSLKDNLSKVMSPSLIKFTEEQAGSTAKMLKDICDIDIEGNELKMEFIAQIKQVFQKQFQAPGKWT